MCARTDSLSIFFDRANDDELPYEVRHKYNDEALKIISKESNDSINRIYHFKVAARYYNMNALEDYKAVTQKIIKSSIAKKDSLNLAKGYSFLGDYFGNKFMSDSAYFYYLQSQKIYGKLKKNGDVAKALLNKAIIQHNEGDFVGCEKSAIEALQYIKEADDPLISYEANNIIATTYDEIGEIDKSLEYHRKAMAIASLNNIYKEYHATATTLNNLGRAYMKMSNYSEAIVNFEKGLRDKKIFSDKTILYAALVDNLAYSKFKIGDFKQLPDLFFKALKIRDSLDIVPGIIASKLNLSEYYSIKCDRIKASAYAHEAYTLAKKNGLIKDLLLCIKQLSEVDPQRKEAYSEEYIRVSDSLQHAERQIRNKLGRIEYETDQLVTEKANLVQQRKTLIYSALGIILIGVFIFVIRLQRAKNRELRLIKEQQKANEEIYNLMITQQQQRDEGRQLEKKRIARELHDGVMGQLSAIRMNLFALDKKQDEQTIRQCLPHIEKIQHVEKEIRNIAYDLDAPLQSNTDFTEVIHTIFAGLEQHSGIRFVLEADDSINWNSVLVDTKVQLYRILQEALQNIVKYANAGKVMVSIGRRESMLRITVQDDGIGFDPDNARKGLGLRNMRQRAQEIGGTMTVTTALGAGTILQFELPDTKQA
ncbi:sensor histidine kinase [Flavobacterium sp.]|uniref:tetratricopeptide repeat-containing sensor histidine kinase n=1 Tax=Flavobacterium sp. TaxID=239 RepID=UPI00262896A6|nr:sensor histidine kinase [Flavobacterium sp.]